MPRLDTHPAAREEIREAAAWYAERSPDTARRFRLELRLAKQKIVECPTMYPPHLHGTRKILLGGGFPYSIVYHEILGSVKIIAVAHGSRDEGYWRRRIK